MLVIVAALGPGAGVARAQAEAPAGGSAAARAIESSPAPAAPSAVAALLHEPLILTRAQARGVQRALGQRVDGVAGRRTRAAIRRWELRRDLPADGRPDAHLLGKLGIALTRDQVVALVPGAPATAAARPAAAPGPAAATAIQAARAQLGTPYRRAGAAPGGFDCSGLAKWAFSQAGVALPHSSFAQARLGAAVPRDAIKPGDLVFFSTAGPGASDVGIATGPTTVISATTKGVREHATFDSYWGAAYVGARRVP